MNKEQNKCPRCRQATMRLNEVENALSRRDNETYICSACGNQEAFFDAGLYQYLDLTAWTNEKRFKMRLAGEIR